MPEFFVEAKYLLGRTDYEIIPSSGDTIIEAMEHYLTLLYKRDAVLPSDVRIVGPMREPQDLEMRPRRG